jgi:hypothetical protein
LKGIGKGKILVILAAGPSINENNFEELKGHKLIKFMCINQPHSGVWPADYWAFCDHTQYRRNMKVWDSYDKGMIFNSANVKARRPNQYVFKSKPGKGFSRDPSSGYHIGRSSTYAAMQVVYYMNFDKVYLFGVDMSGVDGKLHYYGQNPDVSNENRKRRFAAEAEHYGFASNYLADSEREKFVFCSNYNKWPFTKRFPTLDHTKAVKIILERADKLLGKDKQEDNQN